MSDETPALGGAFENVDTAEVFADTPLADEFEDGDSTAGEAVGAFVGRNVGAWAGGVLGTAVLEPLLSSSEETDDADSSADDSTDSDDSDGSDSADEETAADGEDDEGGDES